MLRVYASNRLEVLADVFVQRFREVATLTRDPLRPLELVVPSMGTGQWLRHTMADALGIAAQFDARLPASFAWQVFRAFDPSLPLESEYTLDRLRWRLFHLLPSLDEPVFAPLRDYLGDADAQRAARKRFQLATRLAVLFDQYLVYRRDWIAAFEGAPFAHVRDAVLFEREPWQPALWQRLVADIGAAPHRARVFDAVLEQVLDTGTTLPAAIPSWVSVFGVPALPPDLVLLFGALGTRIDVDVLLPNACSEYWAQIVSPRALAVRELRRSVRVSASAAARAGDAESQSLEGEYYETGQPLLASCGRMSRDGVDLLNELVEALGEEGSAAECFVVPDAHADASMLERLQGDILALRLPDSAEIAPAQRWVRDDDDSIQVHVCHSALREVEVLHDRLLAGFAADPALEPRHMVVMVPDLETYAPIIEAVFDSVPPARRIRVAIADRLDEGAAPVVAALRQLLRLDSSRWTASEVLALLDIPAIQARFDLADERLQQARHWLRESGVRWGRDADDWRKRGLPVVADAGTHGAQPNTWAFGLERLLLGYAMPDGAPVFDGVAPVPGVEGQAARALDGVLGLLAQMQRIERELRVPADASTWQLRIERWVNALFAPARDDADTFLALRGLRDVLRRFVADQPAEHAGELVPAAVVREYLEDAWEITPETPRYLTGAVTVCTLLPMRTIPFAHVHLLGMNERDFPRQASPPTFDLMAHGGRRKGDRVRRDEDRQLFLDAVLSARQRLHLSYLGLSDRSGAARNPSVLVSELLEVLEARFVMQREGASLHAHLVHEHPLQPFSGKYDGQPLVTFEDLWTQPPEPQVQAPMPVPATAPDAPRAAAGAGEASPRIVSPNALRQFLRRPARWTLRNLLDARTAEDIDTLEDDEPMVLDGLDRYALQTAALDALRAGRFEDWCAQVRASGQLPHGLAGSQSLERWRMQLGALLERAGEAAQAPLRSVRIDLSLLTEDGAPVHVQGDLDRIGPRGYVHLRVGTAKPRDFADAYLAQLLLCATGASAESCVVDEDRKRELPVLDPAIAQARLARIVALYREASTRAVPLFVDTAQVWAQSQDEEKALRAWGQDADPDYGARFGANERFDTDVQLVWGDLDAPPGDWQRCADAVYGDFGRVFAAGRGGKGDGGAATP